MTQKKARASHVWPKAKDDWYVEGEDCTLALLDRERFTPVVIDPACGGGNVIRACRSRGHRAWGSDLRDRGAGVYFLGARDFLTTSEADLAVRVQGAGDGYSIICNPPFGRGVLLQQFIRHALSFERCAKVAIFSESRFLGSEERATGLWRETPPNRIYWVTPRPSCPPGEFLLAGGRASGGTPDFVWSVWDRLAPLSPGSSPAFGWAVRPGELRTRKKRD